MMRNFKRAVLFTFLGFSTISLSGPNNTAVKMKRKYHFTGKVSNMSTNTVTDIDVNRKLEFYFSNSKLDGEDLKADSDATVSQFRAAEGEYDKIIADAKEKATAAALEESDDPSDEDYIETYNNTYNRIVLQNLNNLDEYNVDCRKVAMKMIEDMILQKVQHRVVSTKNNGVNTYKAVRYYSERKDPTEKALILKNLKHIKIIRGSKSGFTCTATQENGETILCGKLEITYAPKVASKGPLKGVAYGVVDSSDWRKHLDPKSKTNHARFSDFMTLDNFYYLNQVATCGLAEVQKSLEENNNSGNHVGELGLADKLERWKNEEINKLSNEDLNNDGLNGFDAWQANPDNAAQFKSEYEQSFR